MILLLGTCTARNGLRFLSKSGEADGQRQRLKIQGGSFVKGSFIAFYEYPLEARRAGIFNGCRWGSQRPERGRLERKQAFCACLRDLVGRVRFSGPMLADHRACCAHPKGSAAVRRWHMPDGRT